MPRKAVTLIHQDAFLEITDRLYAAVFTAVASTVRDSTFKAEEIARQKAPIRKVFALRPGKQPVREMSAAEYRARRKGIKSALGVSAVMRMSSGKVRVRTKPDVNNSFRRSVDRRMVEVETRAKLDNGAYERVSAAGFIGKELNPNLKFALVDQNAEAKLTTQGRMELRSGRALSLSAASSFPAAAVAREAERFGITHEEARQLLAKQPILGGGLRASIKSSFAFLSEDDNRLDGYVSASKPYAIYVEFGTVHAAAQPFLRPALKEVEQNYRQDMYRALSKVGRPG